MWQKWIQEVRAFQWHKELGEINGVKRNWNLESMRPKGSPYLEKYYVPVPVELEGRGQYIHKAINDGDWVVENALGHLNVISNSIFSRTFLAEEEEENG